jgi:hypothetical protein
VARGFFPADSGRIARPLAPAWRAGVALAISHVLSRSDRIRLLPIRASSYTCPPFPRPSSAERFRASRIEHSSRARSRFLRVRLRVTQVRLAEILQPRFSADSAAERAEIRSVLRVWSGAGRVAAAARRWRPTFARSSSQPLGGLGRTSLRLRRNRSWHNAVIFRGLVQARFSKEPCTWNSLSLSVGRGALACVVPRAFFLR